MIKAKHFGLYGSLTRRVFSGLGLPKTGNDPFMTIPVHWGRGADSKTSYVQLVVDSNGSASAMVGPMSVADLKPGMVFEFDHHYECCPVYNESGSFLFDQHGMETMPDHENVSAMLGQFGLFSRAYQSTLKFVELAGIDLTRRDGDVFVTVSAQLESDRASSLVRGDLTFNSVVREPVVMIGAVNVLALTRGDVLSGDIKQPRTLMPWDCGRNALEATPDDIKVRQAVSAMRKIVLSNGLGGFR